MVRDYALETLADPDAVLVIDETGFLKQGKSSCGMGRQYTGSAGSPKRGAFAAGITNCQIGVFETYVSRHGHAFNDRALYLPKAWTDDPARMAVAHVPDEVGFATKPRLARRMVERAITAGVPFAWVTADTVYGVSELEMALRRAGKGYVLGVNATASSTPGSASRRWPARPKRSRKRSMPRPGNACLQAMAPRERGCMTGPTSNWPTSMRTSSIRRCPAPGRAACWSGAQSPTRPMRSSPPGARRARASTRWSRSRDGAGRKPSRFHRLCRWNTAGGHRGQFRNCQD